MSIADFTIHIDETLDHDRLSQIVDHTNACKGVTTVIQNDERPHLILVKYDPEKVTSGELLQSVLDEGVHAQMIGF